MIHEQSTQVVDERVKAPVVVEKELKPVVQQEGTLKTVVVDEGTVGTTKKVEVEVEKEHRSLGGKILDILTGSNSEKKVEWVYD